MKTKNIPQARQYGFDVIRWLIIIILLSIMIISHYYMWTIRIPLMVIFITMSGGIFYHTMLGKYIVNFIHEAYIEMCQIIWPSRQEALHVTLIVSIATILISLILWGLDSLLIRIMSFITNLRF